MGSRYPTITATSAWVTPKPTTRLANQKSWCPAPTAAAQVRVPNARYKMEGSQIFVALNRPVCARRPPILSAVHAHHDGGGEDVPLAVHRVQVLQHVRNLGERRELTLGGPAAALWFHSAHLLMCVFSRTSSCSVMTAIEDTTCTASAPPCLSRRRVSC